jgi:molybdopterin/thiamine biosynthesis adenylyltransferase/rhodanese-related sulfurtransferase
MSLPADDLQRYQRQLSLPEITPQRQLQLKNARILIVGAGGLGTAALPYLAGAGAGHITIADHDAVSLVNLHRQTIFTPDDVGKSKAECAALYAAKLNPLITAVALVDKITADHAVALNGDCDLIIDGTDNFETKDALNHISIKTGIPLISASVEQWSAQAGIFNGSNQDAPCYRCLFPQLPKHARNCNEAGILGTSAGLAGLYQAHLALCYLLGIENIAPGLVLSMDFKTLRLNHLTLGKDPACAVCAQAIPKSNPVEKDKDMPQETPIRLVHPSELQGPDVMVIDVRTAAEVQANPIAGAVHIELSTIPQRYSELPQDKRLAFACAANMRSAQAAAFVQAMGHPDVCIYDVLAG